MFGWLGPLFRLIGRFGPIVLICAFIFLVGVLLSLLGWAFGFTLDDVDAWLAAHSSWITAAADVLFRLGCFFVLLCCAVVVVGAVHGKLRPGRRDLEAPPAQPVPVPGFRPETPAGEKPPGLGCALAALVVGYFAFVGTFMRY